MTNSIKHLIQAFLKQFNYRLQSLRDSVMDADADFNAIYERCRPYTLTTRERSFSLYETVKYIVKAGIPGDFVECGVWRGGGASW